ncbi:hypothetical protein KUTeg_017503 [Tegillarca granosa]|uniref:Uncharacterized protein n=1 Tax=Tegillarca granosa TaxID=220873 RepID=A0ABQ9EFG2_TEGGR|nr:hypothetical protein KUTeg_017503 [Tegillarca granosa]
MAVTRDSFISKKMGSASSRSSQVQALQAEPTYRELGEKSKPTSTTPKKVRKVGFETESPQVPANTAEVEKSSLPPLFSPTEDVQDIRDPEINNNLKDLEKQLAESESEKLDLLDMIDTLQQRVEYLETQNEIKKQNDNITETLYAKDQYITKLEKDQQTLKDETTKLKLKHKKRIKTLTSQLNEAKQETSIQLFELKDEINRLTTENESLQGLVKNENSKSLGESSGATDLNKMKIVLELSNQISEQTDKIKELEKSLLDKDKTIEQLRSNSHASTKPDALKYFNKKYDSGDLLKASYEGNVESAQAESLRKLSVGLSHYDKTQDSNVYNYRNESSDEEELRGLSGASRDSGIGSGKKNGRNGSAKKPASRLSTLSDSDWETDEYPMTNTKIRSAPPEKQAKRVLSRVSSVSTKTLSDGEDDAYL